MAMGMSLQINLLFEDAGTLFSGVGSLPNETDIGSGIKKLEIIRVKIM